MTNARRFGALDTLLADHGWLWRPHPFKEPRPAWCARLPGLCGELLALADGEVAALAGDADSLIRLVARHIPALADLEALIQLPSLGSLAPAEPAGHLAWDVPGRKWAQIEAFAEAMGEARAPLLEWCGGKGHLGRLLGVRRGVAVKTLEWDATLCEAGRQLARRARVEQAFVEADVLALEAAAHLPGRHALALHACGDLHRTLVNRAAEARLPALDLAPCCYHRTAAKTYQPWSPAARLTLSREDLRLAVTETQTAAPGEVRGRDLEMAWKLGYDLLRRETTGDDRYRPFKPVPREWRRLGFEGFCRSLAAREGVVPPASVDWGRFEEAGWTRQRETMRLLLLRHAFRRPLEIWLVLDMANHLASRGYQVEVGTFCPREVTPRNILVSARG
jgi:hypothetical protein